MSDPKPVSIIVCPAGPLLVRGAVDLTDSQGAAIEQRRGTVALCRCGRSTIAPFCDGTHKLLRRAGTPPQPRNAPTDD